jgi:hypothetical protein
MMRILAVLVFALPLFAQAALPLSADLTMTVAPAQLSIVTDVQLTCSASTGQSFGALLPVVGGQATTNLDLTDLSGVIGPWTCTAAGRNAAGVLGPVIPSVPASFTLQDPVPTALQAFTVQ